jgi:hypothetical protein
MVGVEIAPVADRSLGTRLSRVARAGLDAKNVKYLFNRPRYMLAGVAPCLGLLWIDDCTPCD